MKQITLILALLLSIVIQAQTEEQELPYYEIPEYSETFTAGTVAARLVDALGFRFYWATEHLSEHDLGYKPNDSVRTTGETVKHIYNLSKTIVNSTLKKANIRGQKTPEMSFEEQRRQTLINLKTAADILRQSDDISQFKIISGKRETPFWNQINGPIADAIWHCGQIASFRRTSGNAINPKVNHFYGTIKE
ncbi:hypothetical protein [Psychroserpens ponticola]|uniref:DinB family protein n=1 Tax=Psychroserpens ponticola TaxID=2932268 RepID=A0ABY7S099_9FLAO|nr:hypothetical protein [Psychroserpens ponticola]WCO02718.1 hypothetical protein MUN68_004285 [Psychroserpens ponticola]